MTGPNLKILNRAQAEADAKHLIDIAIPVLTELVDNSTWVYLRCIHAGDATYEDLPSFVLYLHIIEMTDGIQVLLSHACCESAVPLLRSSFEAFLSLKYILQQDYRRRSLSWLYFDDMRKMKKIQQLDPESDRGKNSPE